MTPAANKACLFISLPCRLIQPRGNPRDRGSPCQARRDLGGSRPLQTERVERLRARRDDHALGLQVRVERLQPELTPEAGLLVAAERNSRKGRVWHVDPDR